MGTRLTGNKMRCLFVCLIMLGMSSDCVAIGMIIGDVSRVDVSIRVSVNLDSPDYVACSGHVMVGERTLAISAETPEQDIGRKVALGNTLMFTIDRGTCDGYTVMVLAGFQGDDKTIEHTELPANIYITGPIYGTKIIGVVFWKRGEHKEGNTASSEVPTVKDKPTPAKTADKTFLQKPLNLALLGAGVIAGGVIITQLGRDDSSEASSNGNAPSNVPPIIQLPGTYDLSCLMTTNRPGAPIAINRTTSIGVNSNVVTVELSFPVTGQYNSATGAYFAEGTLSGLYESIQGNFAWSGVGSVINFIGVWTMTYPDASQDICNLALTKR